MVHGLRLWQGFLQCRVIYRERIGNVMDYYCQKLQVKSFASMKLFVELEKEKRSMNRQAEEFHRSLLMRKSLASISIWRNEHRVFTLKTKELKEFLRARHCPDAMQQWKHIANLSKHVSIRNSIAESFLKERYAVVAFQRLFSYSISRMNVKEMQRKAFVFNCEQVMAKAISSLRYYAYERRQKAEKRELMFETVARIDQEICKENLFEFFVMFAQ
jgi:hypothetical protein